MEMLRSKRAENNGESEKYTNPAVKIFVNFAVYLLLFVLKGKQKGFVYKIVLYFGSMELKICICFRIF